MVKLARNLTQGDIKKYQILGVEHSGKAPKMSNSDTHHAM